MIRLYPLLLHLVEPYSQLLPLVGLYSTIITLGKVVTELNKMKQKSCQKIHMPHRNIIQKTISDHLHVGKTDLEHLYIIIFKILKIYIRYFLDVENNI